jgi:hypothetical protein
VFFACGKTDSKQNADPNAPAVVKVAPPILPSDTAKKEVKPVVTTGDAQLTLARDYSLLGAGLAMNDPRLLASSYAPAAELTTPNGVFTGRDAIVKEYSSFGMGGSVKAFDRHSLAMKVVDSTVVDSGRFTVVRKRTARDSTVDHGAYATVWRIQPPPMDWVITKDHLYQVGARPKK